MTRLLLFICSFSLYSSSLLAESFQDYLNSQRDQTQSEFKQFSQQHDDEFERYKKQLQDAFKQYKSKVSRVWGKQQSLIPTSDRDVSYRDNLKQRSVIDYKKGKVTVELALSPSEARQPALVNKKMRQAIQATLNRGVDQRSIIDLAKNPASDKSTGTAVLSGLIQQNNGTTLNSTNNNEFIRQQAKKTRRKQVHGTDNMPRVIISTQIPMVPDHIRKRASRYKAIVNKHSANMQLPPELVFAIMETESMFNPNARSSVPAFGLMQLVPTSGARDAYRLLFKKDKIVTDRYLYNPDNNVKLGTAFIHKLYYIYFDGIKNPQARTWAAIAGYNTGAGNVFNSFAGKYRRSKFGNRSNWKNQALSLINSKTPEQVYQHLRRNLPHAETQRYIKNIRKRIPKYRTL